jgi:hypothetical protein
MKQPHMKQTAPVLSSLSVRFSEAEIIHLTEKFLEPGFHHIQSATLAEGRATVTTLLHSLKYYHATGCLTLAGGLKDTTLDIYQLMLQHPELSIHELMCSYVYCDFLWIETTQELMAAAWYPAFTKGLQDLKLNTLIPIIVVSQAGNAN